jgi:Core-2/I-Branching enzyme
MKLAYLIMAHNTLNHFGRLINALNSPDVHFFIHVDRKSNIVPYQEKNNLKNITFIEDRVSVFWGEFSLVQATLNLIITALDHQNEFDYLILISGSDYPLKNPKYINNYFAQRVGTEFINLVEMPNKKANKLLNRLYNYQPQTLYDYNYTIVKQIIGFVTTKVFHWQRDYIKALGDLKPYAGSEWWALSASACHYILEFTKTNPKIVKFFQNTFFPDESFFQTIIGNSKFKNKVTRNLTFTKWKNKFNPEFINMEDLQDLLILDKVMIDDVYGCGELLFARKFQDDSAELTNLIDIAILNQS